MSILPWDDWFYHTKGLSQQVQEMHQQALMLQGDMTQKVSDYNKQLDQAKQLVAGNGVLLIVKTTITAKDALLKDFDAKVEAAPEPPEGSVPAKFGSFISELIAGGMLLKSIGQFTNLLKGGYGELGAEVGEGSGEIAAEGVAEAGVEVGVEAGTEVAIGAALSETGVGIIIFLGIDAIFGAINGKKEKEQLDAQIDSLSQSLTVLEQGIFDINSQALKLKTIVDKEKARFQSLAASLQFIIHMPHYRPAKTFDTDDVLAVQTQLILFYSTFLQLRTTYIKAVARGDPHITKAGIINAVLIQSKAEITEEILERMWIVLAKNSDDFKNLK